MINYLGQRWNMARQLKSARICKIKDQKFRTFFKLTLLFLHAYSSLVFSKSENPNFVSCALQFPNLCSMLVSELFFPLLLDTFSSFLMDFHNGFHIIKFTLDLEFYFFRRIHIFKFFPLMVVPILRNYHCSSYVSRVCAEIYFFIQFYFDLLFINAFFFLNFICAFYQFYCGDMLLSCNYEVKEVLFLVKMGAVGNSYSAMKI